MEISDGRRHQRALLNYAVKNKILAENAENMAKSCRVVHKPNKN